MNKLNKLAVASAVTAALGGAGTAQAITLAEPGGALLVPYAIYDTTAGVNTLVGITVANLVGLKGPWWEYDTITTYETDCDSKGVTQGIHWFFFNEKSEHVLSGILPATCEDFVPFDWGSQVVKAGVGAGVKGYLVFTDHGNVLSGGTTSSGLNMYGDAAVIQGNWGAAAFIPVIPLRDASDDGDRASYYDEVIWDGKPVPQDVGAVNAGMRLGDGDWDTGTVQWDMRYYLSDLGLGATRTDLVVWLDNNYDGSPTGEVSYKNIHIDVYDENEVPNDAVISLPNEVNVVNASTLAWTQSKTSGFILVTAPEVSYTSEGSEVGSAVAFSLLFFGPSVTDGVQTILAHERGIFDQDVD